MIVTLPYKAGLLFPLLVLNFRRFARNFVLTGITKNAQESSFFFFFVFFGTRLCLRVSRGREPDAGRVGVAIQVRRKEEGKERASDGDCLGFFSF
jgi:hypothetical protein